MSSNSTKTITIIGYSRHGFVATDVFLWQGARVPNEWNSSIRRNCAQTGQWYPGSSRRFGQSTCTDRKWAHYVMPPAVLIAYCDGEATKYNPFSLRYRGRESDPTVIARLNEYDYFVALGEHSIATKFTPDEYKELDKWNFSWRPGAAVRPRDYDWGKCIDRSRCVVVQGVADNSVIIGNPHRQPR